ncbi:PTS system, N-acetylglucosamine-specific IIA component [Cystobacter fuscus DSM 2262]|uniref:PTS system, N-acetylglucosamine-specific IIA component n=1 Tax=Cystobacter fuscus (strain ATCC 25194 / DSM 2262 / NBRC 100088 / M29) TaxID=1242864 RepID=S9PAS5_CYSF2|nr:N-acetylglucosamine-specific PTS transporter subunit IIBC [Cystobacter fuscus]EPX60201.1 PTS system, N-acetylglucosamine-specific IIA component [Cystobacter fuscus DSM 2262]
MVSNKFAGVQQLGRALMLPIAVLPIAGLLLRLGQPDLLGISFMAAAGGAIFDHLGLLFAVGVAVGFARENHGAAGLAGAVGFFITIEGTKALVQVPPAVLEGLVGAARDLAVSGYKARLESKISMPAGILSGLFAGMLYNRYKDIKLPEYLAFFGGRRFIPIITGLACLVLALVFGFGWPVIEGALDAVTRSVFSAGRFGLFLYGFFNRLLLVTGLHHILNNVAWFLLGDYNGVTGDLKRFFAGDPTAGAMMTGFFPVMMFGLPAACLAMYRAAPAHNRAKVGGLLTSMALTSFLTGVTEPIEFAFMFLAPPLYLLHAVLTGVALVAMDILGVKLGFGFSAGLFDYVLNFKQSTQPWLLLPVGAAYFALYYGLFSVCISRFDLKTLGREDEAPAPAAGAASLDGGLSAPALTRGEAWLKALGGASNIQTVDACTTRLRLTVADNARIDEPALKSLGSRGVIRPSPGSVQVIIGPQADQVSSEIQEVLRGGGAREGAPVSGSAEQVLARGVLQALGGASNVREVGCCSTRLRLIVVDDQRVNDTALKGLGTRGVAKPSAGSIQVIIGPTAERVADELRALLR